MHDNWAGFRGCFHSEVRRFLEIFFIKCKKFVGLIKEVEMLLEVKQKTHPCFRAASSNLYFYSIPKLHCFSKCIIPLEYDQRIDA